MTKYSAEEKVKMLEGWKSSGKGAWEYARAIGVKGQTFSKWVKKETGGRRFVEIKPKIRAETCIVPEIIVERGEIRVRLPLGTGGEELRTVIEVLRREV
jgi:transposase-like protein